MKPFGTDPNIKIDQAHADLLTGLVQANKPRTVLEMGAGGGASLTAILAGLEYNQQDYAYTLVDNWLDFGFKQPPELDQYRDRIQIITSAERDYVMNCNASYDFIMSDADHQNAEKWFDRVYNNLLNPNGILVYHDVNLFENDFPNLRLILEMVTKLKINHKLFNVNSRPDERCQRGLLVIFKDLGE